MKGEKGVQISDVLQTSVLFNQAPVYLKSTFISNPTLKTHLCLWQQHWQLFLFHFLTTQCRSARGFQLLYVGICLLNPA